MITAPVLYPGIRHFLATQNGPGIQTLSPAAARQVLIQLQLPESLVSSWIEVKELSIPYGEAKIKIRIVRSRVGPRTLQPVILYIHGGGWVLGSFETHSRLIGELAAGTGAAVVFVEYTLAPEAQFPRIHDECLTVAHWIRDSGREQGLDSSRVAIMGDSVGAGMATSIVSLAEVEIRCQVLLYPVTDDDFETPSYRQFATGYWLSRDAMRWFWDLYAPNPEDRLNPLLTPLHLDTKRLQAMPPTLLITGEADVLRDEGEAYAHRLIAAGVDVVAARYQGLIHDFAVLNAITTVPGVRGALDQCILYLSKHLAPATRR